MRIFEPTAYRWFFAVALTTTLFGLGCLGAVLVHPVCKLVDLPFEPQVSPPVIGELLLLHAQELEALLVDLGEKPYRARQVLRWLHQTGETDFSQMTVPIDLGVQVYKSGIPPEYLVEMGRRRTVGGQEDLIEQVAISTLPSLRILAPQAIDPRRARILLAGLSEAVDEFAARPLTPGPLTEPGDDGVVDVADHREPLTRKRPCAAGEDTDRGGPASGTSRIRNYRSDRYRGGCHVPLPGPADDHDDDRRDASDGTPRAAKATAETSASAATTAAAAAEAAAAETSSTPAAA